MIIRWILALMMAASIASSAQAQTFPALNGQRVVDAAGLLNPAQVATLTAQSEAIEKASTRQFIVATIPDLQGYPIENYGYKLGRAWGIGQKDANNGIILIVAPKERKVRIEVGYGLEPIMTDALSSQIIQGIILPRFKAGDMPGGIIAGAEAIAEQMTLPLEAAEGRAAKAAQAKPKAAKGGGGAVAIFWVLIVLFFILPMLFRRAGGRRYRSHGIGSTVGNVILWSALNSLNDRGGGSGGSSWGGGGDWGGGGGGGFSGGGGSFGGGGASGGW
ncbi:MAG: methanol dehydrogenase [Sphingomonas sp. 28-66-16]|nr:MAG: methanol dehydrogenase [Sphingomonas sp. 28-66-16]